MITLAVTGGIGSGKSTVCRFLSSMGVPVYDSDSRTRKLYDGSPGLVRNICTALGCDVSLEGGGVDRRRLASVIFSDAESLKILESIVHPAVKQDFLRWKSSFAEGSVPFVAIESAIILEKPLFKDIVDKVLLVDAPVEVRLERACRRDGVQAETVLARMRRQTLLNGISSGIIHPDVDYVIVNDSDEAALYADTADVFDSVCRENQK